MLMSVSHFKTNVIFLRSVLIPTAHMSAAAVLVTKETASNARVSIIFVFFVCNYLQERKIEIIAVVAVLVE